MNLFKSKDQPNDEETFEEEIGKLINLPTITQDNVIDYLLEKTDTEYEKLLKVVKVYRDANKKASDIMGPDLDNIEIVPSDVNHIQPKSHISEEPLSEEDVDKILNDDIDTSDFIESDPTKKPIAVKDK